MTFGGQNLNRTARSFSKYLPFSAQLQVQDSDLEYLIWQFDKRIILSEKQPPLEFVGFYYFKLLESGLNFTQQFPNGISNFISSHLLSLEYILSNIVFTIHHCMFVYKVTMS